MKIKYKRCLFVNNSLSAFKSYISFFANVTESNIMHNTKLKSFVEKNKLIINNQDCSKFNIKSIKRTFWLLDNCQSILLQNFCIILAIF